MEDYIFPFMDWLTENNLNWILFIIPFLLLLFVGKIAQLLDKLGISIYIMSIVQIICIIAAFVAAFYFFDDGWWMVFVFIFAFCSGVMNFMDR